MSFFPRNCPKGLATAAIRRSENVTRVARTRPLPPNSKASSSTATPNRAIENDAHAAGSDARTETAPEPEQGAMSRRLEQATEEALVAPGRSGRRAVEDAGFSEELKARLLGKIAEAQLGSTSADKAGVSSAVASLPASAGRGTREIAAAQAWTGEEATEDAVLRMLDDARKPLAPHLRGRPASTRPVDLRPRRGPQVSAGQRAADARERAAAYSGLGADDDDERAAFRTELRARFEPGARRVMPSTVAGLAGLANERIEDAMARGQFRGIPRGPGVAARDGRADNPFVDTTEYIMNKMIKRQDLVPPWIEKQQELTRAARVFRARLRADWRRHAARSIAARGGGLDEQMRRARAYAAAEEVHNPRGGKGAASTRDPDGGGGEATTASTGREVPDPTARPFRDPAWEAAERAYMELAVANLNALARSYNLMAPDLAKKPYFSLSRELDACFADVAPQLADAIKERAAAPPPPTPSQGSSSLGVFGRFGGDGGGPSARVHDSKAPHYGFKEMWRDLWGTKGT